MFEQIEKAVPIYLTQDEAMALLDLCMMSQDETQPAAETALYKVAALVRQYITKDSAPELAVAR